MNDKVVTLPTPERVSALHFEELSDSIAMTRQMLEETADTFGMLDHQNRELDLLLSSGSSSKKSDVRGRSPPVREGVILSKHPVFLTHKKSIAQSLHNLLSLSP